MNIHGYKLKLKKDLEFLRETEEDLNKELRKRGRNKDELKRLDALLERIKKRMAYKRRLIKQLKQERKKIKKK